MLAISPDCVRCGACVECCPAQVIVLEEGGFPEIRHPGCIRCGHCAAICPTDALRNSLLPADDTPLLPRHPLLGPEDAELFLRARRSVRVFLPEPVPREATQRLLNVGRYAQTGSNSQGVSYLVLEDSAKIQSLRKLTMAFYERAAQVDPVALDVFNSLKNAKRDRLFRGAPMLLFALTDKSLPHRAINTRFTLAYIELYAPSLGLGTCWAGYLERYLAADEPALRALLELPEHLAASGALLYGRPKYRYRRAAARDPLQVIWR